ncbi:A24 family peptidase [Massilia sp. CF038]|uniref:prepilin peptidase n=1 Tax=Massilia sp. CF038 TaxID=1881045 RepID=UPI000920A3FE|nr:A24 family peptidase [Massilia sp. CF038]SHH24383.1 type 4 prepilin peptidase 1 Aspartic peptidase. MEROPS family A24A [Massilia sp. CF038]
MDQFLFAAPFSALPTFAAALFGLLIGSFLNVVIHRMPKMLEREFENACAEHVGKEPVHTDTYTLSVPRSACPHCGHKITALENVPVISYLVLRGKCRGCKAPISARYPAIELLSGVTAAWMIWQFGSGWAGLGAAVFGLMLIAMTFIDLDTQYLPDDLTLPLLWLGLLINIRGAFATLPDAVLGAAAGYLVLWGVNALFKLVRKMDGMGGGDFKLLAALGAWMGWQMLPAIILLSSVVGAVVGISLMMFAGNGRDTRIPFGPYLAGAGMLALLFRPEIATLMGMYFNPGQPV